MTDQTFLFSTSQIRSEKCFQNCTADVFVTQSGGKYPKETRSEGQQCGDDVHTTTQSWKMQETL